MKKAEEKKEELKRLKGYEKSLDLIKAAGFPTLASILLTKQENETLKNRLDLLESYFTENIPGGRDLFNKIICG